MKKRIFIRTFLLLFNSSPARVSAVLFLTVISGIIPSIRILISIRLINLIARAVTNFENFNFTAALYLLIGWAGVTILSELMSSLQGALNAILTEKFSASIMTALSEKLASLKNLSFFETAENLVKVDMVREQIQVRPQNYVFNLTLNLQKIINLLSMITVLFSVDYLLPVLMIFSTIPVFLITQKAGRKQWDKTQKLQNEKLKLTTYIKHSLEGEKAKDNFLFGFTENFKTAYCKIRDEYLKTYIQIAHKGLLFGIIGSFLSAIIGIGLFFIMIFIVIKKHIEVGAISGYVQTFMYTQCEIQDLATYGRWYFILMGYFQNFFALIDWNESAEEADKTEKIILKEKIESIELKNVWFGYDINKDDEKNYIIKDFSLFIDGKKNYAVVGKNGSGKTTLVKLLSKFYTPQRGSIIINGKYELKDLDTEKYQRRISAVFQDFAIYTGYTMDENIFVKPEHSVNEENEKLEKINFLGQEFKQRLESKHTSLIGMQYGGEEFSGGQRQRIATLRSFIKQNDVMFFDEPTSAIDPIAENEFIESIFTQTKDKISVIVTHRMGSVKFCDEIIVMDNGMLAEQGSFNFLISKNGLFAKLYNSQKKGFTEDNSM
nr:ABC transporter ATP-binding protein [Treponema pedis]